MTDNRIIQIIARVTSIIFHPLLIPTLGFVLLLNSDFYFALLPWSVKKFMLLTVFLSTCILPALSILILSMSPKFDMNMEKSTDRILPLLLSSVFYYLGYLILEQLPVYPILQPFSDCINSGSNLTYSCFPEMEDQRSFGCYRRFDWRSQRLVFPAS